MWENQIFCRAVRRLYGRPGPVVDLIRPGQAGTGPVEAKISGTRVTMKIIILSLLITLVVSQSTRQEPPPGTDLTLGKTSTQTVPGQRCSGRNYNGRRCCTPEQPCGLGEGDCDGPLDGGTHDGHQGCKGDLVCGSNNCRKFGAYFHEKDDCCDRPENLPVREEPVIVPGTPLEPPAGSESGRSDGYHQFPIQVRDVGAVTTTGRGAVLQSSLVTRERETVMDLQTGVNMTDTLAVRETSCVGVTTARSLELTTTRRTTAARKPLLH